MEYSCLLIICNWNSCYCLYSLSSSRLLRQSLYREQGLERQITSVLLSFYVLGSNRESVQQGCKANIEMWCSCLVGNWGSLEVFSSLLKLKNHPISGYWNCSDTLTDYVWLCGSVLWSSSNLWIALQEAWMYQINILYYIVWSVRMCFEFGANQLRLNSETLALLTSNSWLSLIWQVIMKKLVFRCVFLHVPLAYWVIYFNE